MTFNPCGKRVAYLREEGIDFIRPFRDSDIEVQRRWFRCAPGAPPLGFPDIFQSTRWEPFPELREGAGSVWPSQWRAKRIGVIEGFDYLHVCGTKEDFQLGAVFDPTANVEYDADWIPLCCGREAMCVTQECSQDQVNGRPAAQLVSYPIPHQNATGDTPAWREQWASNQDSHVNPWPGHLWAYYPLGTDFDPAFSDVIVSNNLGALQYRETTLRFAPDNAITVRADNAQLQLGVEQGGIAGNLQLQIIGGILTIGGANAVIADGIMPPGYEPWVHQVVIAAGTTQGTAAPITTPSVAIQVGSTSGAGVRLPVTGLIPTSVTVLNVSSTRSFKIYPGAGDAFIPGFVANAPITIAPQTQVYLKRIATNQWIVEATVPTVTSPPPPPAGTVTSVDISTSSTGVTVGGGPITGAGTLTVDLDPSLQSLPALGGSDALIAGNTGSAFTTVTIGVGLSYTGGVLANTGGPAAGSPDELQINVGGVIGSSPNLLFNPGTNVLDVIGSVTVNNDLIADNLKVVQYLWPNTTPAAVLGTVIGFFQVQSNNGGPTGYIPIYDSIT